MKRILFLVIFCAFLASCGGNNESEYEEYYDKDREVAATEADDGPVAQTKIGADEGVNEMTDTTAVAKVEEGDYAQGKKLIAMSDCLSCHRENEKLVGPAYMDVAKKYEMNDKNIDYLAGKIISGGSGVWGQVPMTPHPDLSQEQAREMAEYVLSLNKK
ncbi:c-type cytochrome [Pontibacter sp. MBLB2868]|uniref:c-type cytochrome n=1 Tax=Pontibacter sp. MBLB2868 TaxID=3451555 RepID=UPI003F756437